MKNIPESGNVFGQIKELLKEVQLENEQIKGMKQSGNKGSANVIPKGRILLINDNPDYGERLIKWCTDKDYIITVAHNAKEALSLAKRTTFDAVINSSELISAKKALK